VPPTLLALADEVIEWGRSLLKCMSPFLADFVAKRFLASEGARLIQKIRRECAMLIQDSIRSDSIVAYFYSTASPR
jgi:hypothetical protein